jgi:hypothetical protein
MASALIDFNPLTGEYTEYVEHTDGRISIVNGQDLAPIIDVNKSLYAEPTFRKHGQEFRRVAVIPNIIVLQLKQATAHMDKEEEQRYLKRWLNDSENLAFRVRAETV